MSTRDRKQSPANGRHGRNGAPRRRSRDETSEEQALLRLQGTAGNAAVGKLLEKEAGGLTDEVAGAIEQQRGGGEPLDASSRREFEPSLGHDLSSVRIHKGSEASALAAEIEAAAFTIGSDVFVDETKVDLSSPAGRRLLSHELTHVAQQPQADRVEGVSSPTDKAEVAATENSPRVATGGTASNVGSAAKNTVHRGGLLDELLGSSPPAPAPGPAATTSAGKAAAENAAAGGVGADPTASAAAKAAASATETAAAGPINPALAALWNASVVDQLTTAATQLLAPKPAFFQILQSLKAAQTSIGAMIATYKDSEPLLGEKMKKLFNAVLVVTMGVDHYTGQTPSPADLSEFTTSLAASAASVAGELK